jgi:hypothetical protein
MPDCAPSNMNSGANAHEECPQTETSVLHVYRQEESCRPFSWPPTAEPTLEESLTPRNVVTFDDFTSFVKSIPRQMARQQHPCAIDAREMKKRTNEDREIESGTLVDMKRAAFARIVSHVQAAAGASAEGTGPRPTKFGRVFEGPPDELDRMIDIIVARAECCAASRNSF